MKINQIKNVVLPLLLLFCLIGCSEDKEPQTYPPTLVTNSAAELTRFEALLSGSVVPHANSVVKAEVFFLFAKGNTLVDAEEFTATPDNTTEGRYVCTIDGLTPGNEYCYSICARSGGSIAKGEVIKFETLSSTAPVPAATIATNINENGALLSSDITDNGGQNVTQRGFAYKVYQEGMPEPTTSDKTRSVSLEAETFSVQISDLQAKTKYIVRAFAINKAGTGYGEAVTFTTEELKIPQLTCSMGTVTAFAATPSATVSTNGGFKLTEYGFCWSTESQVPTIENLKTVTGNSETCGFWPGEIWLAYEATGEEKFKTAALIQVDSFADRIARKVEVDHHDMGFLYSPTCVAAWKLVGSEKGKNAAIAAADQLLTRYQPSGRFLQAWGTMDDPGNYRYIIDCMLNVPLLYWAAQVTGSDHYREIAAAHTATTLANSFRPDGSTYHTFFMNPDGTPKGGRTCQGYKDDSFWARGQAWGVYGSAIGYTYTHDEKFLDVFRKALEFYLSRLPEDMIPCWDMLFAPESGEPRDSSSAAIVACGLLEAAKYVDETEAAQWRTLARQMLASLAANYAVKPGTLGSGQLLHGTYSKKSPYNTCTPEGVDECTSWGDYFYMEALTRLTKDWEMYW